MPSRSEPLVAERAVTEAGSDGTDGTDGATAADAPGGRLTRLRSGVARLRVGASGRWNERILMVLGGVLAPVGVLVVVLGWVGASQTPNLFEQIPYLISGGLLGLALVFLGAFCYFTHWVTELVKEHRAQSAALLEAFASLERSIELTMGITNGHRPASTRTAGNAASDLVATERGTMAHRPDCVVVAGKTGLRAVSAEDGLLACKLCDPYVAADAD
jgi:hypothetical protein